MDYQFDCVHHITRGNVISHGDEVGVLYFDVDDVEKLEEEHPLLQEIAPGENRAKNCQEPPSTEEDGEGFCVDESEESPAPAVRTPVNAKKWRHSVEAAFQLWAEIIEGGKIDWKRQEFEDAFKEKYSDYHTEVLNIAWRNLPERFQHGSGRKKKTPKLVEAPKT